MEHNFLYSELIQMGIKPIMAEAAIKKNKTSNVTILLKWIQQHNHQEVQLAEWLKKFNQKVNDQVHINSKIYDQLRQLGFSKNVAEKAIYFTQNKNLEEALKWIQFHQFDPDYEQELKKLKELKQQKELIQRAEKKKKILEILKEYKVTKETKESKELKAKKIQKQQKNILKESKAAKMSIELNPPKELIIESKKLNQSNQLKVVLEIQKQKQLQKQKLKIKQEQKLENKKQSGLTVDQAKRLAYEIRQKKLITQNNLKKQRDQQFRKKIQSEFEKKPEISYNKKKEQNDLVKKIQQQKNKFNQIELAQVRVGSQVNPKNMVICFKTIIVYLENIVKNPQKLQFRKINTENKAFKARIGDVFGGELVMQSIGFGKQGTLLVLENANIKQLNDIIEQLKLYLSYF